MLLRAAFLLFAGIVLISYVSAQRIRVRRQNMKVKINATGDTIVLKFVRPSPDVKLEGYILGYGSSMFSKQFIQLPEDGQPYETEIDAEPKYLIAVQPIPTNDVKKQCRGKVNLEKPLHLIIGTVTPTSVLLSWGTLLKTPYEESVMSDCLEDGHYTVRYRERSRKWNYQTCPTSDTVIDNLKPNTQYEFGVRPNKDERVGTWSKSVVHSTNKEDKSVQKPYKHKKPVKPINSEPRSNFTPNVLQNRTQTTVTTKANPALPGDSKTPFAPPAGHPESPPVTRMAVPHWPQLPQGRTNNARNVSSHSESMHPTSPRLLPTKPPITTITSVPTRFPSEKQRAQPRAPSPKPTQKSYSPSAVGDSWEGLPLDKPAPTSGTPTDYSWGKNVLRNVTSSTARVPSSLAVTVAARNLMSPDGDILFSPSNSMRQHFPPRPTNSSQTMRTQGVNGEEYIGASHPKPIMWSRLRPANNSLLEDIKPEVQDVIGWSEPSLGDPLYGSPAQRPPNAANKKPKLYGKPGDKGKANDLKQMEMTSVMKPNLPPATPKPTKQDRKYTMTTATATQVVNVTRFDIWDNSSVFSSRPASDVDAMGKKRFVAPHVIYKTDKKPDEPCSITSSLSYFSDEETVEQNVTSPPRLPPSNLTVVTVEGCSSFIILDWEKSDNETTEYEVISRTKGPDGEEVSILTTNQTHTAVENLKPESSYEFKVKPKNELGEGPATDPVSFSTESADPRVSENVSGKDAIWTQFPFKSDSYSECNGKQYVKRTWYRKFVGIQLCNSLRYKVYLSDSLNGKFYNIGDQTGHGEDHCQFVDSFLDGRTGSQLLADQLPSRSGYYRAMRQEPVNFGQIGGNSHITYVSWYECGIPIPGKW
uniref:ABI family, member 3 (NESH) binding protein b n=1 Tax=Scleropages formosus TaxID=113540 RepID=A0A8C9QTH3_SCLFO